MTPLMAMAFASCYVTGAPSMLFPAWAVSMVLEARPPGRALDRCSRGSRGGTPPRERRTWSGTNWPRRFMPYGTSRVVFRLIAVV